MGYFILAATVGAFVIAVNGSLSKGTGRLVDVLTVFVGLVLFGVGLVGLINYLK